VSNQTQYQPDASDFVYLNFRPQAGHEQAGRRPALILSPAAFNIGTGFVFACPIANQGKGGPFEVAIPPTLRITGFVLVDHARSLDWLARETQFVAKAPSSLFEDVRARLAAILFDT
jgi:mRNA interferase MazF